MMACSKDEQPEPISLSDRQTVLHSIGNAVIIRSLLDLQNSVNGLNEFANSYVNDSTSKQKLLELRKAWVNAVVSWKLSSPFLEGNFAAEATPSHLYAPANTTSIENITASSTPQFDVGYMQSLDETSTGLAAIEYLIFGTNQQDTESVISAFKGAGSRRGSYLAALCLNLKRQSDRLLFHWSIAGDGYVNEFMQNSGLERSSSIGTLTDNMISTISRIKDDRIGAPLGLNGVTRPELVESKYSGESLTLIRAELHSLQQVFIGERTTTIGVKGLNWLLDQANAKMGDEMLSSSIGAQFTEVSLKLSMIQVPLEQAVVTNVKQVVDLHEAIKKLQKLLQEDMVSTLHLN
jgi:predicted lipoprotein